MVKRILIAGLVMLIAGVLFVPTGRVSAQSEVILAKVGDAVITQRDFEGFLQQTAAMRRGKPYSPEEKRVMLDNLVRALVVVTEAEKAKMDQTPEFKSKMKLLRIQALAQEYFEKTPVVSVSEQEVDALMKENRALQVPKETLLLKEILVSTENEAGAVYEELKKGANFAETAVHKSKSDTRVNGGSMRAVTRGMLPKELEEAAFSLKKGEFTKPIKTEKGYYILYLDERKEKSPEEMQKMTEQIREKVRKIEESKKKGQALVQKGEELKKKMNVEVFYDRIPK